MVQLMERPARPHIMLNQDANPTVGDRLIPGLTIVSSIDLAKMELPAPEMLVSELIPAGLSLLASPPKLGKSWMALGLGAAVATGAKWLGRSIPKPGRVLYLDAEAPLQVSQARQRQIGWPDGADGLHITVTTGWQLTKDHINDLEAYRQRYSDLRLVICDTLERVIPPATGGRMDSYQAGVLRLAPIQEWCSSSGVSVLLIHHTRKGGASAGEESYDAASGSRGYTGTCETLLTLTRGQEDQHKLAVTSRHMESTEIAVELRNGIWYNCGAWETVSISQERRSIMSALDELGKATPAEIAERIDSKSDTVYRMLRRMQKDGLAVKDGKFWRAKSVERIHSDPDAEETVTAQPTFIRDVTLQHDDLMVPGCMSASSEISELPVDLVSAESTEQGLEFLDATNIEDGLEISDIDDVFDIVDMQVLTRPTVSKDLLSVSVNSEDVECLGDSEDDYGFGLDGVV